LKVLGQGSVGVTAVATDAAGNVSQASGAQSFTIDTVKPTLGVPTLGGDGGTATSTNVNGVVFSKEAAPTLTLNRLLKNRGKDVDMLGAVTIIV